MRRLLLSGGFLLSVQIESENIGIGMKKISTYGLSRLDYKKVMKLSDRILTRRGLIDELEIQKGIRKNAKKLEKIIPRIIKFSSREISRIQRKISRMNKTRQSGIKPWKGI